MDLPAMQAEVRKVNLDKGWWDEEVLFPEAMALLHTEIAEASDAWRRWGTDDATGKHSPEWTDGLPKPEGVGSEFADILIRLLDDDERYGIRLAEKMASYHGAFSISDSFLTNMNTLHTQTAWASVLWESGSPEFDQVTWAGYLTRVLAFTMQLAEHYGIDLMREYRRKVAYNKTRPYRHGGKRK
jgi:hypothetical protein